MILYHGSNTFGIKTLEPHLADHEKPYIYMSTLEIVAGFYMVNAVERPITGFLTDLTRTARWSMMNCIRTR